MKSKKIPRRNQALRSGALQAFERKHPVAELTIRVGQSVMRIKLQSWEVTKR
jgi:hypothetical protein